MRSTYGSIRMMEVGELGLATRLNLFTHLRFTKCTKKRRDRYQSTKLTKVRTLKSSELHINILQLARYVLLKTNREVQDGDETGQLELLA